jgi:hypothetical protein
MAVLAGTGFLTLIIIIIPMMIAGLMLIGDLPPLYDDEIARQEIILPGSSSILSILPDTMFANKPDSSGTVDTVTLITTLRIGMDKGVFLVFLVSIFLIEKNHINSYFQKGTFAKAVLEYDYIKKILYITIPIIVFLIIISVLYFGVGIIVQSEGIFITALTGLTYIAITAFLWLFLYIKRKDFRFYFAKRFFEVMLDKEDETEKIKYIVSGIESYNKYLRRNLKIELNNIVYSKILVNLNRDLMKY